MNKQHKISYDYYGDTRDIFSIVKDSEWPVFLCSNHDKFQDERYDILSANPIEKIIAHDNKTTVENKSGIQEYKDDPIKKKNSQLILLVNQILPMTSMKINLIKYSHIFRMEIAIKLTFHKDFLLSIVAILGIFTIR